MQRARTAFFGNLDGMGVGGFPYRRFPGLKRMIVLLYIGLYMTTLNFESSANEKAEAMEAVKLYF